MTATTPGLVCAHHHLYSALAPGMPAPPVTPTRFVEILEQIWWRLDVALDLEMIEWAARLGALQALESGTTAIIDHHESPNAIEGSLSVIADACAEVGVRVSCAYGVTDRHGPAGRDAGLAENERFLSGGGRGLVGVHAAFTCSDDTLAAAADLARQHGVGVHIHVMEDLVDAGADDRLAGLTTDDWLLVHGVHLPDDHRLHGTMVHNPRSNMNNAVGYGHPSRFAGPVALGTDGVGADMLDEFRVAYARLRESQVTETPETAWRWLAEGWSLMPDTLDDEVRWSGGMWSGVNDARDDEVGGGIDPSRLAFTTGVRPLEVHVGGQMVWADGMPTRVDGDEIRARAAEQAARLFARL